jgi:hypothetical protein
MDTFGRNASLGTYDSLASEYYVAERHPTCAALRQASSLALRDFLKADRPSGRWCEVGAGKSLLLEEAKDLSIRFESPVVVIDSSRAMLMNTPRDLIASADPLLGDAHRLPLRSSVFAGIAVSLGDPFNGTRLWAELARVALKGCRVCFTVPDYEWAVTYRQLEGSPSDVARFVLDSGEIVDLESIITSEPAQTEVAAQAGFIIEKVEHVAVSRLATPPPPKLRVASDALTAYWFRKA